MEEKNKEVGKEGQERTAAEEPVERETRRKVRAATWKNTGLAQIGKKKIAEKTSKTKKKPPTKKKDAPFHCKFYSCCCQLHDVQGNAICWRYNGTSPVEARYNCIFRDLQVPKKHQDTDLKGSFMHVV